MVMYTEQVLYVRNLVNLVRFKEVNWKTQASIWQDGAKVRLLEKGLSVQLRKDDKNVAFGKAIQLSRTLLWQKPEFRKLVLNLFIKRMGNLLPSRWKYPKIWYQIQLPPELGGLNLGVGEEISSLLDNSPYPTKRLVAKILAGADVRQERKLLRTLNSNPVMRTSLVYKQKVEFFIERLEFCQSTGYEHIPGMGTRLKKWWTWSELQARYPNARDPREILHEARSDGITSIEEYAMRAAREDLFWDLLQRTEKTNQFSTVPYPTRYERIWDGLMTLTDGFDPPESFKGIPNLWARIRGAFTPRFIELDETFPRVLSNEMKQGGSIFSNRDTGGQIGHGCGLLVDAPRTWRP
jgi:hypothetical protein